jgi:uncharacterized protein (DUF2384 family)
MTTATEAKHNPSINNATAFKLGNNILDKWKCSPTQKQSILGIQRSTFHRYLKNKDSISLSRDQLERLSYIANIHQTLRLVFSNPENTYGFMRMENNNPFFNGRTPLSLIEKGSFGALYEVFKRVDSMRNGQW